MLFKRLAVGITACSLLVVLGLAAPAQAKRFSIASGSGAQFHIGNGLAIPIQPQATPLVKGTVFPPLLIPVKGVPVAVGTIANPLKTAMATPSGPVTKSGYQRKLRIPANALTKPAGQLTVGVAASNPTVFAVATNLGFRWPAATAEFSNAAAYTGGVVAGFGGTLTYSNTLGARFGGPAQGMISPGTEPAGLISTSAVTVYARAGAVGLPCTHPAFGGTSAGCVSAILLAKPTGLNAAGATTTMVVGTPGNALVGKNVAVMKMKASGAPFLPPIPPAPPNASGRPFLAASASMGIPANKATSQPAPWTTGRIVMTNAGAAGAPEKFTISGRDQRTAGGNGTISLVAGAVSARVVSKGNANRGWLRLNLANAPAAAVPSMSIGGIAAMVGLILLGAGYTLRKRIFA